MHRTAKGRKSKKDTARTNFLSIVILSGLGVVESITPEKVRNSRIKLSRLSSQLSTPLLSDSLELGFIQELEFVRNITFF